MDVWTDRDVEAFIEAAHRAARAGLLRATSGNLSQRLDGGVVAITAKGSWLGDLARDEIALVRLEDGRSLGPAAPSGETPLHLGILRARPDLAVVLHFQSPAATTIACLDPGIRIEFASIPEVPYYIGEIAYVDYFIPNSPDLASAAVEAMRDHDLAILRNHGQVVGARDIRQAIQRAEFFELACEIALRAGGGLRPLSADAVKALRDWAERGRKI